MPRTRGSGVGVAGWGLDAVPHAATIIERMMADAGTREGRRKRERREPIAASSVMPLMAEVDAPPRR